MIGHLQCKSIILSLLCKASGNRPKAHSVMLEHIPWKKHQQNRWMLYIIQNAAIFYHRVYSIAKKELDFLQHFENRLYIFHLNSTNFKIHLKDTCTSKYQDPYCHWVSQSSPLILYRSHGAGIHRSIFEFIWKQNSNSMNILYVRNIWRFQTLKHVHWRSHKVRDATP